MLLYELITKILSIDYGHKIEKGENFDGKELSKAEGWDLLKQDSHERSGRFVNQFIKVGLLQHQFDALSSLTFNIGATRFSKSTLLKNVNLQVHKNGISGREEIRENFMLWIGNYSGRVIG